MQMRAAHKAVYAHFAAAWGATTVALYPNESHVQPPAPFVRVSMVENTSDQHTIGGAGNKLFERRESVYVQIFVSSNAGEGLLLDLAQAARDIFEGASLSVEGEQLTFFQVDFDREDDEPDLLAGTVEAQCRYQQRK